MAKACIILRSAVRTIKLRSTAGSRHQACSCCSCICFLEIGPHEVVLAHLSLPSSWDESLCHHVQPHVLNVHKTMKSFHSIVQRSLFKSFILTMQEYLGRGLVSCFLKKNADLMEKGSKSSGQCLV